MEEPQKKHKQGVQRVIHDDLRKHLSIALRQTPITLCPVNHSHVVRSSTSKHRRHSNSVYTKLQIYNVKTLAQSELYQPNEP